MAAKLADAFHPQRQGSLLAFVLAHLSDLHLPPLPPARPTELLGKRLLSWLSWQTKRKAVHRPEVLAALLDDLAEQAPDHLAVTGDLVNLSLPAEFEAAAAFLARLGSPERVSLVPGNHDRLVRLDWARSWRLWAPWLAGDEARPEDFDAFPTLRRRWPLALVGLSTAVPTPPTFASGRLGGAQLERLDGLLAGLAAEGARVVVLLHHSPLPGHNRARKHLSDAAALRDLLARHGAALVLHGHDHRFVEGSLPGPAGPIPVLGVPSGTALAWHGRPAAHYHLLAFDGGEQIELRVRGYDPAAGRFLARDSRTLALPGALR